MRTCITSPRATFGTPWILLGLLQLTSGCGGPSVVSLPVNRAGDPDPDPDRAPAVRLMRVTDRRHFVSRTFDLSRMTLTAAPDGPPQPSARVLGRDRHLMLVLPTRTSVADWTAEVLTQSFRRAGYAVKLPGEPGYADATPVEADLSHLWLWVERGHALMRFHFRLGVDVKAPLPGLHRGRNITGQVALRTFFGKVGRGAAIRKTVLRAVEAFDTELSQALRTQHGGDSPPPPAEGVLTTRIPLPGYELLLVAAPDRRPDVVGLRLARRLPRGGGDLSKCTALGLEHDGVSERIPGAEYRLVPRGSWAREQLQVQTPISLVEKLTDATEAAVGACTERVVLPPPARLQLADFLRQLAARVRNGPRAPKTRPQ